MRSRTKEESIVVVTKATSYSLPELKENISLSIDRATEGKGLPLSKDSKVAIKVNLCCFAMPESGAVTHPAFLAAFLSYLRDRFGRNFKIRVVESDASSARPDLLKKWLGYEPILERYGAEWVNLSKVETVRKFVERARRFKELDVPRMLEEDTDYFISSPKLKTHLTTKMTCNLKNMFGCVPDPWKKKFHRHLDDIIVDSSLAMRPDFCLVDGIIAMGGVKAPDQGVPLRANVIVSGEDIVAVDCVCARILGFNPYFVSHIRKAQSSGLGNMSCKTSGESLNEIGIKDFEFNHIYAMVLNRVRHIAEEH
jgi:uncharacterized protein (DUF362 family)